MLTRSNSSGKPTVKADSTPVICCLATTPMSQVRTGVHTRDAAPDSPALRARHRSAAVHEHAVRTALGRVRKLAARCRESATALGP